MSLTAQGRALILDLDFTLLHLEYVPDALEVPGRTRSAWIAPLTIELLGALQARFDIVLATARSWDGTRWVSDGLAERGVQVAGVVLEDGARLGVPSALQEFASAFDVERLRAHVDSEQTSQWPAFEWQLDFKSCLVARCESRVDAARLSAIFMERYAVGAHSERRIYRDGRKVYILPHDADKWSALQQLLGAQAGSAAGVGDGVNDLVWLPRVEFAATFARAEVELVQTIRAHGGYVTTLDGHEGIADILRELGKLTAAQ